MGPIPEPDPTLPLPALSDPHAASPPLLVLPRIVATLGMFTLLPVPPAMDVDRTTSRSNVTGMPIVGLVLGLLAGAAAIVVQLCGAGDWLAGIMGLAVLAAATGALHLDGLADTADGLGSRKPAQQALEVMRRSDIGPMGVATLVLTLLVDLGALTSTHLGGWRLVAALVLGPMVARTVVVHATRAGLPGARTSGFGALFTGVTTRADGLLWSGLVLAATGGIGGLVTGFTWNLVAWPVAALLAWGVAAFWRGHLVKRLGGLTGDTFGSMIEAAAATFWVALALLLR